MHWIPLLEKSGFAAAALASDAICIVRQRGARQEEQEQGQSLFGKKGQGSAAAPSLAYPAIEGA